MDRAFRLMIRISTTIAFMIAPLAGFQERQSFPSEKPQSSPLALEEV